MTHTKPTDPLKQAVSIYPNVFAIDPIEVSLRKWIENCVNPRGMNAINCKNLCLEVRATGNKELKKTMPAISPGAVMLTRNKNVPIEKRIKNITGWMQFDIDLKDNPHLVDVAHLRDELRKIVYVAFCSISVSGKGVWGLVKIKHLDKYAAHFKQLRIDFASRGIKLDPSKGGNPTDLRIYSYDPDAYIAKEFLEYDRLSKEVQINTSAIPSKKKRKNHQVVDTQDKVGELICEITRRGINIAPDYETYRNVGFSLANEFGEGGRSMFHAICSTSEKYKQADADRQFSACLKTNTTASKITIASFFYLCQQAGLENF